MSFLLPFLAEAGVFITSGLEEVGLSTGVAQAGSGIAVGAITNKINEVVANAATQIIGSENVQKFEEAKKTTQDFSSILFSEDKDLALKNYIGVKPKAKVPIVPKKMKVLSDILNPSIVLPGFASSSGAVTDVQYLTNATSDSPVITTSVSGGEIAKYLVHLGTNLANQEKVDLPKGIKDTIGKDPVKLTTAQKISNFLANRSLPTSEEYKSIANIYNGKSINAKSTVMSYDRVTEGLVFQLYDEAGELQTLNQNKGLVLPAVPGYIFMGPHSPNDKYPVNLLDTFCLLHDVTYVEGFFNRKGDMQLISRLSQNKDRFDPGEINLVNATIVYFASVSLTLGALKGSLPDNVSKEVINDTTRDDVFPTLVNNVEMINVEEYQIERYRFYKDLEDSLEKEHKSSGYHAIVSKGNPYIGRLFNDMLVEII